jgi:hypothetical protein
MGTLLWTPTYFNGSDYLIEKSMIWGFVYVWQTMCIVQNPPDMIMQESIYGGYRVRLNFDPFFWYATSSAWHISEIITDAYAMAPGSSTPIAMGATNVGMIYYPEYRQYIVVIESVPNIKHHVFWKWPEATINAGSPNMPSPLPNVFFRDLDHSDPVLPPVYC